MKAFPIHVGFEDIVSNLGFDAQQAINEVTRLSDALVRLEAAMVSTAGAVRTFNAAGAKFKGVATNVNSLTKSQRELINVSGQVPRIMKSNFVSLESLEKRAANLSNQIQRSSRQMILSWQSVLRIFTIQVAHQAIARLTGLIRDSLSAAIDYELQLAAIQTINEDFSGGLDETSAAISGLATEFARPVEDIAAGFYNILSDQIENSSDALLILNESLILSRATLSTTQEAASTLTGIINAFGKETFETAKISDILFRTVDLGRITLDEIAGSLGRVNVLSARLGVTFEEQQAALATITIQGIDASEAMTFLRNAFNKLLRPTESMKKAFEEIGVSSAEAGIAAFGLQGFLERLVSVSGDSATELGELFGRLRATQGALALTGENAERFRTALERIADSSNAAREAAEKITGTSAEQLRQQAQEIRTNFIELGRDVNASFLSLTTTLGGAVDVIQDLGIALVAASAVSVVVNFRAIQAAITGIGTSASAAALRFGALTAAFAAAQITLDLLTTSQNEFLSELERGRKLASEAARRGLQEEVDARKRAFAEQRQLILQDLAERTKARQADANNAQRFAAQVTAIQEFQLKQQQKAVQTQVQTVERIITDSQKRIADSQEEILDLQFSREQFIFERRIRNLSDQEQAQRRINEARKIERDAQQALAKGDEDRARDLFDQAQRQRETALSLADQVGSQTLIQQAENAIKRGIDSRINAEKKFQKEQASVAERAETILPIVQRLASDFDVASQEAIDHLAIIKDGKPVYESLADAASTILPVLLKANQEAAKLGVAPAINEQELVSQLRSVFEALTRERDKFATEAGKATNQPIFTPAQEEEAIRKIDEARVKQLELNATIQDANKEIENQVALIEQAVLSLTRGEVAAARISRPFLTGGQAIAAEQKARQAIIDAIREELEKPTAAIDQERIIQLAEESGSTFGEGVLSGFQEAIASQLKRRLEAQQQLIPVDAELEAVNLDQFRAEVSTPINVPVNLIQQNDGLVPGQARGGRVLGFADGGFVPRGTDRIPAMLTKGEFVVNADSTKKFFSELVAINKGINPRYLASGGPVTNVGDINITVRGGKTDRATLRNVAEGLRRELRRGSLRSF